MSSIGAAIVDTVICHLSRKKEPLASIKLPSVELKVGSTVPEKVELHNAPNVKYEYMVIDNRTVVVDPETHTVVKVLD